MVDEEICSFCNETYEECTKKSDLISIIDEINFYTNNSIQINNLKYKDMIEILKSDDIFLKKIKKYLMLYKKGEDARMYLLKELNIEIINDDINLKNTCSNSHNISHDNIIQNIKILYNKIKDNKIENDDYANIITILQKSVTYFEL
jgi:hypothetical protein